MPLVVMGRHPKGLPLGCYIDWDCCCWNRLMGMTVLAIEVIIHARVGRAGPVWSNLIKEIVSTIVPKLPLPTDLLRRNYPVSQGLL